MPERYDSGDFTLRFYGNMLKYPTCGQDAAHLDRVEIAAGGEDNLTARVQVDMVATATSMDRRADKVPRVSFKKPGK